MWDEIVSLIFPERCIGCEKSGNAICAICERTITMRPKALSGTTATLFDYRNPLVKKAIWALKYHRRRSLGKYFGNALYREFFKQLANSTKHVNEAIVLIPVPASAKAVAMRGFNHASVIASAIARCAKEDGLMMEMRNDILYKLSENSQQAQTHGKRERALNVAKVFAVRHGEFLRGKTVILVDDVITTGATLAEARRAVKEFAPKRILAIAVAH